MIQTSKLITFDRECSQYLIALGEQLTAKKPLPLVVNGLSSRACTALLCETVRDAVHRTRLPCLILAADEKDMADISAALCDAGLTALKYPYRDMLFDHIAASHDTERERLFVLHSVMQGGCDAVITTLPAALQLTMPCDMLQHCCLTLHSGMTMEPDALCRRLTESGYVHVDTVESPGQYTRRGGIVDLCGASARPIRIEFFGDEVDRMGFFDPQTQRMCGECEGYTLLPAREVLCDDAADERLMSYLRRMQKKKLPPDADRIVDAELCDIRGKTDLYSRDKYISLIYETETCMLDYLTSSPSVICLIGSSEIIERERAAEKMLDETVSLLTETRLIEGKYAVYAKRYDYYEELSKRHLPIYINQFSGVSATLTCGGLFGFRCRHTPSYADNFKMLCEDLRDYLRGSYRVLVLCPHASEAASVAKALCEADFPAVLLPESFEPTKDSMPVGTVYVGVSAQKGGFDLPNPKVALLSMCEDETVAKRRRLRTPKRKMRAGEQIMSYNELSVGDYVVHETYGIGCFEGISKITVNGVSRDYISIRYLGTDKLFVPADRLEMISKYIGAGAEDKTVKLSKMGSPEWQKAKSRAKGAAKDLARELVALYAARQRIKGYAYPPDSALEREFEETFEFDETDVQLIASAEIKADMEKETPMDRLLCGDVGFGKTEVALRAAFKAICAGKQVALLVPTTILALQHYQTALSRMRSFAVSVDMISRFRTPTEQTKILRRLERGDIDLIVGTHSLLSKKVKFKDLGLLIVDEEQRFGVAQKEKLKQLAQNVDVLTLTATPIPRTLHMAMSGIRDMSVLDEAPSDRFPVQTYVMEHDDSVIFDAMRRELRRGGQVLYLYNRTDNISSVAAKIAKNIENARVTWAHGQMEHDELEAIWQSLVRGEVDILVCTTIIETGVDLPNANTLIIEDADRMGLSQLHQLRGRVGRSGRRAFAFFTYRRGKTLSDVATKRLEAIREYAEFGAGFRIAMRDLEIRGAGNLLGSEQHGNIEAVGYDLYIRILNQAITEQQGNAAEPPYESTVEIAADALIPEGYIASSAQRMEMYKKISHILCEEDVSDILDEFCDRFGDPPAVTVRLLSIALIRANASHCRIQKVEQRGADVRFVAEKIDLGLWSELFASTDSLRITAGAEPTVMLRLRRGEDAAHTCDMIMRKYRALFDEKSSAEKGSTSK